MTTTRDYRTEIMSGRTWRDHWTDACWGQKVPKALWWKSLLDHNACSMVPRRNSLHIYYDNILWRFCLFWCLAGFCLFAYNFFLEASQSLVAEVYTSLLVIVLLEEWEPWMGFFNSVFVVFKREITSFHTHFFLLEKHLRCKIAQLRPL